MSTLMRVQVSAGKALLVEAAETEISPHAGDLKLPDTPKDAVVAVANSVTEVLDQVRTLYEDIVTSLKSLKAEVAPKKISVELGLNVSVEGNIYVVKGTAEGAVKISAEWGA